MKRPAGNWLRASQAAAVAGVLRWTIWKWTVDGVIPPSALIQCGSQFRISRAWAEGKAVPC